MLGLGCLEVALGMPRPRYLGRNTVIVVALGVLWMEEDGFVRDVVVWC